MKKSTIALWALLILALAGTAYYAYRLHGLNDYVAGYVEKFDAKNIERDNEIRQAKIAAAAAQERAEKAESNVNEKIVVAVHNATNDRLDRAEAKIAAALADNQAQLAADVKKLGDKTATAFETIESNLKGQLAEAKAANAATQEAAEHLKKVSEGLAIELADRKKAADQTAPSMPTVVVTPPTPTPNSVAVVPTPTPASPAPAPAVAGAKFGEKGFRVLDQKQITIHYQGDNNFFVTKDAKGQNVVWDGKHNQKPNRIFKSANGQMVKVPAWPNEATTFEGVLYPATVVIASDFQF